MARTTATVQFQALELKGGLLPASLLEDIAKLSRPRDLRLEAADHGLNRGERLRDPSMPPGCRPRSCGKSSRT
ncbi:MAG: hypothetical protein ERJ67_11035 [Aphanocapsa feldmannii 277cV]|uniref:Uncharacterized protein n=2 Tax=Aphanocapsa feldmannii TaxID=192050 RepID=A0A524RKM9_9CHRO|nr:MAG: hypothetical protein ERJ67_11035 [Aphanocapsa feldmannii 277cV]TGH24102.1 MAG: hypothetical protein ERJ68_03425 [Aphanocapsa feldmannii 277cI]